MPVESRSTFSLLEIFGVGDAKTVNVDLTERLNHANENFRRLSACLSSSTGTKTVIDPFAIEANWFVLDFSTFYIKANPDRQILNAAKRKLISDTIEILKLNDDDLLVEERMEYFLDYKNREIGFSYLKKRAPFIAYEMERQGLLIP